jgi:hypothetical protein
VIHLVHAGGEQWLSAEKSEEYGDQTFLSRTPRGLSAPKAPRGGRPEGPITSLSRDAHEFLAFANRIPPYWTVRLAQDVLIQFTNNGFADKPAIRHRGLAA